LQLVSYFRFYFSSDKKFRQSIKNIFGFYPGNVFLYKLALRHKSATIKYKGGIKINNERLEYLGDAVISLIVADFLFRRFPYKSEGFLTDMRSKIVSRSSLNKLANKLGLKKYMQIGSSEQIHSRSAGGDAFEAMIGAIYLDKGFRFTKKIVIKHILSIHYDLDKLQKEEISYKSKMIEWAQKTKQKLDFVLEEEKQKDGRIRYKITTFVDDKPLESAYDYTIKGAENLSAEKSWSKLAGNRQNNF